jgi:uncharacterized alkaline shock family protein YloU
MIAIIYLFATLLTGGLGVLLVLFGTGTVSLSTLETEIGETAWVALHFLFGGTLILSAVHFLSLFYRKSKAGAHFFQEGEWGKVEVSPHALQEFISGVLREELGVDNFRIKLRHKEGGIAISVTTTLSPNEKVNEISKRIQQTLARRVVEHTGVEVREVAVLVHGIHSKEIEPPATEEEDEFES